MNNMLFTPTQLGSLPLKNRIVMAPLTRSRAIGNLPNELMAEYYRLRADAGLIITEGTSPSPNGLGYPRIPGLFNEAQVQGWRPVTDGVHQAGGRIFVQLMPTGRVSHPANMPAGAGVLMHGVYLGAVFWAMQVVLIGNAKRAGRPITLGCIQLVTAAVAGLAIASVTEDFNWGAILLSWKELLFAGVFSSAIAFTLQAVGQRYTTSAQAAIFLSSEALFAAISGAIFLGDRLTLMGFLGCGMLFAAMLAVELVPMLWSRKAGPALPAGPTQ